MTVSIQNHIVTVFGKVDTGSIVVPAMSASSSRVLLANLVKDGTTNVSISISPGDTGITKSNASGGSAHSTMRINISDDSHYAMALTAESGSVSEVVSERAISFNPSGTRLYVTDGNNDRVYQYALDPPYDLSTLAYAGYESTAAWGVTSPYGIRMHPNGSRMYITCGLTDAVYQIYLSSAFDVTSAYSVVSLSIGADHEGYGVDFNGDGTKIYVGTDTGVYIANLSTPYDINSASGGAIDTTITQGYSITFSSAGRFVHFRTAQYELAIPYDLSSVINFDRYGYNGNFTYATHMGDSKSYAVLVGTTVYKYTFNPLQAYTLSFSGDTEEYILSALVVEGVDYSRIDSPLAIVSGNNGNPTTGNFPGSTLVGMRLGVFGVDNSLLPHTFNTPLISYYSEQTTNGGSGSIALSIGTTTTISSTPVPYDITIGGSDDWTAFGWGLFEAPLNKAISPNFVISPEVDVITSSIPANTTNMKGTALMELDGSYLKGSKVSMKGTAKLTCMHLLEVVSFRLEDDSNEATTNWLAELNEDFWSTDQTEYADSYARNSFNGRIRFLIKNISETETIDFTPNVYIKHLDDHTRLIESDDSSETISTKWFPIHYRTTADLVYNGGAYYRFTPGWYSQLYDFSYIAPPDRHTTLDHCTVLNETAIATGNKYDSWATAYKGLLTNTMYALHFDNNAPLGSRTTVYTYNSTSKNFEKVAAHTSVDYSPLPTGFAYRIYANYPNTIFLKTETGDLLRSDDDVNWYIDPTNATHIGVGSIYINGKFYYLYLSNNPDLLYIRKHINAPTNFTSGETLFETKMSTYIYIAQSNNYFTQALPNDPTKFAFYAGTIYNKLENDQVYGVFDTVTDEIVHFTYIPASTAPIRDWSFFFNYPDYDDSFGREQGTYIDGDIVRTTINFLDESCGYLTHEYNTLTNQFKYNYSQEYDSEVFNEDYRLPDYPVLGTLGYQSPCSIPNMVYNTENGFPSNIKIPCNTFECYGTYYGVTYGEMTVTNEGITSRLDIFRMMTYLHFSAHSPNISGSTGWGPHGVLYAYDDTTQQVKVLLLTYYETNVMDYEYMLETPWMDSRLFESEATTQKLGSGTYNVVNEGRYDKKINHLSTSPVATLPPLTEVEISFPYYFIQTQLTSKLAVFDANDHISKNKSRHIRFYTRNVESDEYGKGSWKGEGKMYIPPYPYPYVNSRSHAYMTLKSTEVLHQAKASWKCSATVSLKLPIDDSLYVSNWTYRDLGADVYDDTFPAGPISTKKKDLVFSVTDLSDDKFLRQYSTSSDHYYTSFNVRWRLHNNTGFTKNIKPRIQIRVDDGTWEDFDINGGAYPCGPIVFMDNFLNHVINDTYRNYHLGDLVVDGDIAYSSHHTLFAKHESDTEIEVITYGYNRLISRTHFEQFNYVKSTKVWTRVTFYPLPDTGVYMNDDCPCFTDIDLSGNIFIGHVYLYYCYCMLISGTTLTQPVPIPITGQPALTNRSATKSVKNSDGEIFLFTTYEKNETAISHRNFINKWGHASKTMGPGIGIVIPTFGNLDFYMKNVFPHPSEANTMVIIATVASTNNVYYSKMNMTTHVCTSPTYLLNAATDLGYNETLYNSIKSFHVTDSQGVVHWFYAKQYTTQSQTSFAYLTFDSNDNATLIEYGFQVGRCKGLFLFDDERAMYLQSDEYDTVAFTKYRDTDFYYRVMGFRTIPFGWAVDPISIYGDGRIISSQFDPDTRNSRALSSGDDSGLSYDQLRVYDSIPYNRLVDWEDTVPRLTDLNFLDTDNFGTLTLHKEIKQEIALPSNFSTEIVGQFGIPLTYAADKLTGVNSNANHWIDFRIFDDTETIEYRDDEHFRVMFSPGFVKSSEVSMVGTALLEADGTKTTGDLNAAQSSMLGVATMDLTLASIYDLNADFTIESDITASVKKYIGNAAIHNQSKISLTVIQPLVIKGAKMSIHGQATFKAYTGDPEYKGCP